MKHYKLPITYDWLEQLLLPVEVKPEFIQNCFRNTPESAATKITQSSSILAKLERSMVELSKKKKILESKITSLRQEMAREMKENDINQVHTEQCQVILKKKPAKLIIEKEEDLPFHLFELKKILNKKRLKLEIQEGKKLNGAHLSEDEYTIALKEGKS